MTHSHVRSATSAHLTLLLSYYIPAIQEPFSASRGHATDVCQASNCLLHMFNSLIGEATMLHTVAPPVLPLVLDVLHAAPTGSPCQA